jgi:hypothetical protein
MSAWVCPACSATNAPNATVTCGACGACYKPDPRDATITDELTLVFNRVEKRDIERAHRRAVDATIARLTGENERLRAIVRGDGARFDDVLRFATHRHYCQVVVSGECSCGLNRVMAEWDAARKESGL